LSEFDAVTEVELGRMGDDRVLAYIAAAREAGDADAVRAGMGILAWGYEQQIVARVAAKVPRESVEDVVMEVLFSILNSAFDGKVLGEFRSFMSTIVARRIADFHRGREADPGQDPLPGGSGEDGEIWGEEPSVGDSAEAIAMRDLVEGLLATRSPVHRRIIRLYGPEAVDGEDLSAAAVVARLAADGETVSESNVQQVWHRFKVDLGAALATGEDGGAADG
jgi:DNA-directed RNA polymerase specialized sigma24 family protein